MLKRKRLWWFTLNQEIANSSLMQAMNIQASKKSSLIAIAKNILSFLFSGSTVLSTGKKDCTWHWYRGLYWKMVLWTVLGPVTVDCTGPCYSRLYWALLQWTVLGPVIVDCTGPCYSGLYWALLQWTVLGPVTVDCTGPCYSGLYWALLQ